jgi:hypothetical protein
MISDEISKIFPHSLTDLTRALKECIALSRRVEGVVTLSIHEPGRRVPFRAFKAGVQTWAAESADT